MLVVLKFVDLLFMVFMIMIFVRILSSWIPELQGSKILQFVSFYTDPYLNIFRAIIPPLGMIDISPIIAFLCLGIIEFMVKWLVMIFFRIIS